MVVTLDLLLVDPCRLLVGVDSIGLLGEVVSIGILVGVDPTGPSGGVYPVGISVGVDPAGLSVGVGTIGLLPLGCAKVLMMVVLLGVGVMIGGVVFPGVSVDGSGELTWRPSNS